MHHSLQYIIFTSCNVGYVILYCKVGWCVKDRKVHHSRQQWFVTKWLGLGVTVGVRIRARAKGWNYFFFFLCVKSDKDLCVALLAR